jgi:hypothetical protein
MTAPTLSISPRSRSTFGSSRAESAPEGPNGKMTIRGEPSAFLSPQPAFVRMRGGEYRFQPGIAALRAIATCSA